MIYNGAEVTTDADVSSLYNFCKEDIIDLTKVGANFVDLLCICVHGIWVVAMPISVANDLPRARSTCDGEA